MHKRARARAAELGISFVEYVRRLVEADLGPRRTPTRPTAVFDLGRSGGADVARRKDVMIGDGVARDREGPQTS